MENFFKKIDNLSGKIDIKYKGKSGYKNIVGGILILLIYISSFEISIYFV
jgi:hypothetical protein